MAFYINLFAITAIISFMEFFDINRKIKNILLFFVSIIYVFFGAFRWNGVDWKVYYSFYTTNNTLDDFFNGGIEKGFALINYIVKSFTNEYTALLFILAIFIIYSKVYFIKKYAIFPLISLLYWFGTNMGDIFFIRQTLAIAITIFSLKFIINKEPIKFIILIMIASTIQISSLFFLPAYYVFNKNIKIKYMILGLVFCIILGNFLEPSMLSHLNSLLFFDEQRLSDKIEMYAYNYGMYDIESNTLLLGYIRRLMFLPLELWAIKKISKIDPNYRGYINLIVFGYMLYFLLTNLGLTFAFRANSFYVIYEYLTIPALFFLIKRRELKVVLFFIFAGYLFFKYMYFIEAQSYEYIPYLNVLLDNV